MPTEANQEMGVHRQELKVNHVTDVIAALCGRFDTAEALRAVVEILDRALAAGIRDDDAAIARIEAETATIDPILRESALAHLTGDLTHYVQIISLVRNVIDLAPLDGVSQIYWSMSRQFFLMRMNMDSVPRFIQNVLFPFYSNLVAEVARRQELRPRVWRSGRHDRQRVVMVTNQFLSPSHQPTRDLLAQAGALQERGDFDVTILNTNMLPDRYHSPFVPPFAGDMERALDGEQTLSYDGARFRIISSTLPGMNAAKIAGFIDVVDKIDPEAVIAVGGSTIIADLLASSRPCLCLQTTSGFTVSLADLILDFGGGTQPRSDDHYARAWRPFRLGLSLRQESQPAERGEFGIPDDAFAVIVIGNRLDYEVTPAFLDLLHRLVERQPAAFVVFAGPVAGLPERLASHPMASHGRCLGRVDNIGGLAKVCDVYANPQRTGGGASALQALAAGIPIVTFSAGDVASVAGPRFCVSDADAFVARLLSLFDDSERREEARTQASRRYAELVAEGRNSEQLVAYIDEAQKIFTASGRR